MKQCKTALLSHYGRHIRRPQGQRPPGSEVQIEVQPKYDQTMYIAKRCSKYKVATDTESSGATANRNSESTLGVQNRFIQ